LAVLDDTFGVWSRQGAREEAGALESDVKTGIRMVSWEIGGSQPFGTKRIGATERSMRAVNGPRGLKLTALFPRRWHVTEFPNQEQLEAIGNERE
jgi:hypothetical protein